MATKTKARPVYCPHFQKESKKTGVYIYTIGNSLELNLCDACEKKFRKQVTEQEKAEKECGEGCWGKKVMMVKTVKKSLSPKKPATKKKKI